MNIILLFFVFLIFPLKAWAYFDPGFGGYLGSSLVSFIMTGLAFVSAAVIYFFRTIIGLNCKRFFQRHRKYCLILSLILTGIGVLCLVGTLIAAFYKPGIKQINAPLARVIDGSKMFHGYNLFDGELVDEKGQVIKKWSNPYVGIIDKNGDYYAGDENIGKWGRYTWDDKIVWEKAFPIHHELYLSPQGTIFTFTRETRNYNKYKVDFDVILEFDKAGKELQRFSFWEHMKEFQLYKPNFNIDTDYFWSRSMIFCLHLLKNFYDLIRLNSQVSIPSDAYDYFHINSFFIIPPNSLQGKDGAFRPGNWLVSAFHGSMVFILDQDTKKVLWHVAAGQVDEGLQGQHAASMLHDGSILLFENGDDRRSSRILKIDPLTLKIVWQFGNKDFFSGQGGFVQPLFNGNLLVTESDKNHVFELTQDKKIVWEYFSPFRNDDTIYRMTRYPKEMIDRFIYREGK